MGIIRKQILKKINNYGLRKKLLIIYFGCVILPLIITDSLIFRIIVNEEKEKIYVEQKAVTESVYYDFENIVNDASNYASRIYCNKAIDDFLETNYEDSSDYYQSLNKLKQDAILGFNIRNININFCSNNGTIVSGGLFLKLSIFKNEEWMNDIRDNNKEGMLCFYYLDNKKVFATPKRQVSFIRKLNYFKNSKYEKYVKCDLDYSRFVENLEKLNSNYPIYVCSNNKILYSNVGYSEYNRSFFTLMGDEDVGYTYETTLFGLPLKIMALNTGVPLIPILKKRALFIVFMLGVNIFLPVILFYLINDSISKRMSKLTSAFDNADIDNLKLLTEVEGSDEIGKLMRNYNKMVIKSNDLIKTVYKDKMEKQEIDLARQNAELLALHSQINPHFLFNILESIRMHSVLKKEKETADMIAKLSVLVRKNVEWKGDYSLVSDEMKFIENYLILQKYRFGDRLDYDIFVEPNCLSYYLPKLTLVTFVENACVHGMENKAGVCKIYIRVYEDKGVLYLEVEDTGSGMDDEMLADLRYKMENCSIEMVKESKHIGIVNACLRLKMITDKKVKFTIESEKGVGTFLVLMIPTNKLTKEEVEFYVKSDDC